MSNRPHPSDMALAPEGHPLRFGIFKTFSGWVVQGNREDRDGDNWWSSWHTHTEAVAAAVRWLKEAAEDLDWCETCQARRVFDGDFCRACGHDWSDV